MVILDIDTTSAYTQSWFSYVNVPFNSVYRAVLWQCPSLDDIPEKVNTLNQSSHEKRPSGIHVHGGLLRDFTARSDICQGFPLSPQPSLKMRTALRCAHMRIMTVVFPDRQLYDMDRARDYLLKSKCPGNF